MAMDARPAGMPDGSGPSEAGAAHWRRTRTLTLFVLCVWALVALVVHCFADALNQVTFLGFPLGYYMATQGSLIVFVILIFYHNWRQDVIDRNSGFEE